MPGRLAGKRVLVTGASSGIGLATARLFAAEGASLALLARDRDALERVAGELEGPATVVPVDVTDRAALGSALDAAVAELGGLDVLIANAAGAVFGHFLEVAPEDFDRAVEVTLTGTVNVTRAALPHLRASRGAIVATVSLVSRVPMPAWSSYTAAKHGVRGFLNALRVEEREQRSGVRVAMVHPGVIDTPFWAHATSVTGFQARVPADAYDAEVIARALLDNAIRPRRETIVGGVTVALDRGYSLARPIAERVLVLGDRLFRTGNEEAPSPGVLWKPSGGWQSGSGVPGRGRLRPRLLGVACQMLRRRRELRRPLPEHGPPIPPGGV